MGVGGSLRVERLQQQISFGNDRKKSKGMGKSNSRFPAGMTDRKARAWAKATADFLRE
jgi:hypothetical protein